MSVTTQDVVVIGAGQAGLAAGYYLRRAGLRFTILEAGEAAGGAWPRYYQSLRLLSPARYSSLPGDPFPGDPARLPSRDEVISYLRGYAERFDLPIQTGAAVRELQAVGGGFRVRAADGRAWRCGAVIAATGSFDQPHRPKLPGLDTFAGRVCHAAEYCHPEPFAQQRVLVVGGGNSGVQIAVELAEVADVVLATRRPIRFVPRKLLGMPLHFWLRWSGIDRCPLLSGGPDPVFDCGRYRRALDAGRPPRRPMFDRLTADGAAWPDGTTQPFDTLLLATGYRRHHPYLQSLPGAEQQRRGVSRVPGIFFVGTEGQSGPASASLRGVGRDARAVIRRIQRHLLQNHQTPQAVPPAVRGEAMASKSA